MKLQLKDGAYDVLKWLALIAIPAVAVLYNVLASTWGWPFAEEVSVSCNAVEAFLGALIGISTASYNKGDAPLMCGTVLSTTALPSSVTTSESSKGA